MSMNCKLVARNIHNGYEIYLMPIIDFYFIYKNGESEFSSKKCNFIIKHVNRKLLYYKQKIFLRIYITFCLFNVEYDQKQRKDRAGLITSSSIATVLLIYIIVLHICLIVRHRTNRTRRGNIEEPLHFNTYDEIGPISYEAASARRLVTNQEGPMLPTRLISSPRNESNITTINNRSAMIVSTSSKVSHQYFQVISARSSYDAETEISTSSMLPIGDMMHSDGSYDEVSVASTDNSYQTFQRSSHQDENSSNNNKTSTCSSSSDVSRPESHGTSLCEGDANENPYELAIDDNKETHQYSVVVNQCAEVESGRPTSDSDELTSKVSCQSTNDKESCH